MKKILLFLLVLFVPAGYQKATASHVMGAYITYRSLSPKVYEITLKVHRDCRGQPYNLPYEFGIRCLAGGATFDLSPVKVSIADITPGCAGKPAPCNPANTLVGNEGVEMHTLLDTVDFGQGRLDSLMNAGCCGFRIFFSECCRNGATNTGAAGLFYVESMIDLCKAPGNNSPVVFNDIPNYLCCNMPYTFNMAAYDADHDSLSYQLISAQEGTNTSFTYNTGYSSIRPLTPYFPGGWSNPNNTNPNANPPIGFYLDPVTGTLIFTPTGCSEVGPVVIRVNEWRKDSTGTYQRIGEIRRDIPMTVKTCPGNYPPGILGNTNYTACEGNQLCFDVVSKDIRLMLPPPQISPPPDTVDLTVVPMLPAVTFTKLIDTAGGTTSRFCWTPQASDVSSLPHYFTVVASDRNCSPRPAVSSKTYSILVKPSKRALIDASVLNCGRLRVNMVPVDSGITSLRWEIKDSTGKLITTDMADKPTSLKKTDTLQFRRGGKYIISLMGQSTAGCIKAKNDTVVLSSVLEVNAGKDTVSCYGTAFTVSAGVNYSASPYRYQWSPAGAADTLSSFTFTAVKDTLLKVTVTGADGCVNFDDIRIKQKKPVNLRSDTAFCYPGSVVLDAGAGFVSYSWSTGDTIRSVTAVGTAVYKATVTDSNGCVSSDSAEVTVNPLPQVHLGNDTSICKGKIWPLDAGAGYKKYTWNTGDSARQINTDKTGDYKVAVVDSNGCTGKDSIRISVFTQHLVNLGPDATICKGNTLQLDAGAGFASYSWSTGATTRQINVSKTGKYSVMVADSQGCISEPDTIQVKIDSVLHSYSNFSIKHLGSRTYEFMPAVSGGYIHYWGFGDGTFQTPHTVQHTYTSAGNYTICHRITNANGCIDSTCKTLQVTGIAKIPAELMSLTVYPNPFHDGTLISLQLKEQAKVSITLYDILGREYMLTSDETLAPGQFTQAVSSDELHLPSGMFTVKVSINGADTYLKLVRMN